MPGSAASQPWAPVCILPTQTSLRLRHRRSCGSRCVWHGRALEQRARAHGERRHRSEAFRRQLCMAGVPFSPPGLACRGDCFASRRGSCLVTRERRQPRIKSGDSRSGPHHEQMFSLDRNGLRNRTLLEAGAQPTSEEAKNRLLVSPGEMTSDVANAPLVFLLLICMGFVSFLVTADFSGPPLTVFSYKPGDCCYAIPPGQGGCLSVPRCLACEAPGPPRHFAQWELRRRPENLPGAPKDPPSKHKEARCPVSPWVAAQHSGRGHFPEWRLCSPPPEHRGCPGAEHAGFQEMGSETQD